MPSADQQDRLRALTLRIRGLGVGDGVKLENGVMIRSVTMRHGSSQVRRFAVTRSGERAAKETSAAVSHANAEEAARAALAL